MNDLPLVHALLVGDYIMDLVEILKIGGGVAGLTALVWRVIDDFGSHLRISLKVDGPKDGWITALTTVENKGNRPKDVSYACLLVGPECENPVETARSIAEACGYEGELASRKPTGTPW